MGSPLTRDGQGDPDDHVGRGGAWGTLRECQRGDWSAERRVNRPWAFGSCALLSREGCGCLPVSICAKPEPVRSQRENDAPGWCTEA